ncbi:KpsF/GutQ family sugar-phosphate isomerase [Aliisedimentitalea scapharcae]|uniref:KpsF/GutQ family sugar-phosphate isomerase n=1 Tax=Aliisedimentitalea scapharcae TaxID=1524259 RepID=A0ABZ2XT67_9RHOB
MSGFQDTARRVVGIEAQALSLLADSLDDSFDQAVDTLLNATGRVIISGMGKSGHIARKIAATLASTGTPAHFVHPAEASHGDLGMMAQGDVALVLSNSGETPELADMVAYTRRFAIPLIGVASRAESTLLKQSDVALLLPAAPEACGSGIVPTTSTTMTLALGDALAIALMEHRQFTPEHFREFHPGGKLGARLSKVQDLMHTGNELPLVQLDTPMGDALIEISQKGFGVTGVVGADGGLVGIITDGDLRRNMDGLLALSAKDVMTRDPATIRPGALAEEAVAFMNTNSPRITCLMVVDSDTGGDPIGLLHIHDCLRVGLG